MPTAPAQTQATMTMQGIQVPSSAVNPPAFFAATRRQNLLMANRPAFAGLGATDLFPILQTGIVSALRVRVYGTVVVTPSTGSVATTYQWPYGLIKALRFTANGQSDLINISGPALKMVALASRFPVDDRGVSQGVGGASPGTATTQGTLSMASESWGVGKGVTAIGSGTYDIELVYDIPVAYDPITLLGAVFAQTQSTNLTLEIDWNTQAALFNVVAPATAVLNLSVVVEGTVFTIPSVNGGIVIPNLTAFHSLTQITAPNAISNGNNEITLAGQGVGRKLMRLAFRTWSNAIPLAMNATNYQTLYWRFGGNTTPETFVDGRMLRQWNEQLYNTDLGAVEGWGVFDFSSLWAQRDDVDEGAATQLRYGYSIGSGVSLTNPYGEYVQQAIIAGAVAA